MDGLHVEIDLVGIDIDIDIDRYKLLMTCLIEIYYRFYLYI
jgi:hypothetical protein